MTPECISSGSDKSLSSGQSITGRKQKPLPPPPRYHARVVRSNGTRTLLLRFGKSARLLFELRFQGKKMQIKDKKAMVIGACDGLGMAFSKELLRNGAARVLMIDMNETLGRAQADRLNEEFGRNRATFTKCDVTKGSEFDACFKDAVNTLGALDIIVNNAAMIDEVNFHKTIDTNVTAVFRASMMGVQQMGKDTGGKGGVIVNVASVLGLEACPQLPIYSATNHAVIAFSRSFSQPYHYQRTGVRLVVLCPGLTESPMLENLKNEQFVPRPEELLEAMKEFHPQRAENVAHALVYVIRCAQNGSVWITEDSKPVYEIQLPDSLPTKEAY
ncbi:hypothetical protein TSAR_016929 [Trichomalopsis sarcophagae]|uniref:15-hydroxyprostaglandin dehydrogenase [NAD(+)] n=1 Tax=Trichomalopsis sarcophagae TaxID=543379 RepID=A0A232EGH1_9HYME|nr:hypothetical protein TSAR_016929 [Trichomalopsis sarcophagae]